MRTYLRLIALPPETKPEDPPNRTLGGIAKSLQNRGLACVCSSNNENSELDILRNLGEELLCVHNTDV